MPARPTFWIFTHDSLDFTALQTSTPDHYATLGLHRRCTDAQIRAAYRILAKRHHPDVNNGAREALARTQELNAAYEILGDPARRQAYDEESTTAAKKSSSPARPAKAGPITKEIHLAILEFLRGAKLDVRVNDPGNPHGAETYQLVIPPETAPGTRFKISRNGSSGGGFVLVRVKAKPDFRFKVRGSDLRCDLKISSQRASLGGVESVRGATGSPLRVQIPKKVSRGEIIRLPGEGLPKPRGGRGDLLVRITYRPEVRITRASSR
jgi:curved DNA-binding protein